MRSRKFGYLYNQFIQAWNTIFFGALAIGGAALSYYGHWTAGLILLFIGAGGFYFCQKQLRQIISTQEKEEKEKKK